MAGRQTEEKTELIDKDVQTTQPVNEKDLLAAVLAVFKRNGAVRATLTAISIVMRDRSALQAASKELVDAVEKILGVYEEAKAAVNSGLKGRDLARPMSDMARQALKEYDDMQKSRSARIPVPPMNTSGSGGVIG